MNGEELAARRQLLVATACLQRTTLQLEVRLLQERAGVASRQGLAVAGVALAVATLVAAWRRSHAAPASEDGAATASGAASAGAGGAVILPLLRLLTQGLALLRLWRATRRDG